MEPKLVSVIIPTYNRAEYLKQAIQSVLEQTYIHFELLILDNCSTDHTSEIVAQFSDSRIQYIRHQCNIRTLANWSYGVYWAKGDYLCILGDDDWYAPTFISSRAKAFSTYENIVAVFSTYDICNVNREIQFSHPLSFDRDCVLFGKELVRCSLNGWFLGSTLYKSEIVQHLFERVQMAGKAGDTSLNINIAISEMRVAWINSKGLFYRNHENQDSIKSRDLVWVGHIAACSLPMMFAECKSGRKLLSKHSSWAFNYLGRNALYEGNYKMESRFVKMELSTNYFKIKTWLKLILCYTPVFLRKKFLKAIN